MNSLNKEFNHSGFSFPKYLWTLPKGSLKDRLVKARKPQVCGPYYTSPKPLGDGTHPGQGFYLNDAGSFSRWQWADEILSSIRHEGWYCDDLCSETIRGLVVRLPHGRYLAGWSMGEKMASMVEGIIFHDIDEAARYADQCAESAAEKEKDYQAQQAFEIAAEEALREGDEENYWNSRDVPTVH